MNLIKTYDDYSTQMIKKYDRCIMNSDLLYIEVHTSYFEIVSEMDCEGIGAKIVLDEIPENEIASWTDEHRAGTPYFMRINEPSKMREIVEFVVGLYGTEVEEYFAEEYFYESSLPTFHEWLDCLGERHAVPGFGSDTADHICNYIKERVMCERNWKEYVRNNWIKEA